MTNELMDDYIRYLRKWLNEENASPVDRVALATVLHEVVDLRDRMGGSEGLHRINAHKIKFLKDQLAAAQAEVAHWKNNHETEVRLRDKQLAEAQNRIAELEKDAARYRFIRQHETWEAPRGCLPKWHGGNVKWIGGTYSFDEIDAIIDAALEQKEIGE